jgi:RNA polymerase sigma factor (sigma-70 family)
MRANVTPSLRIGDAELLESFRARRRSEASFDEIVARHGAMVFATCTRILRDSHAAEDATQGVFLALARQPQAVRGPLPGWLYEVARRTSLKLLRSSRRRAVHEREAPGMTRANDSPRREDLDAALASLPALLREAIVLRYLQGRSQAEAARAAGCPQGTLGWRAMEGLNRLRSLLSPRGAAVTSAALVALLAKEAHASVPPALLGTLKLSALTAAGGGAGAVAQGVAKGLMWFKVKMSAIAVAAVTAVTLPLALSSGPPEPLPQEPPQARPPMAADYNITLLSDSAPDFTDIDAYLRSITSQFSTPQEKAIAVWRWSQRLRKQTSYPTEDGHEVLDPIQMFTSYGYTMCGIISGIDNSLWLNLGWKAHYVQLGDHTVCECSWDGGKTWHMFDNSMSFYCFNDRGEVAGTREIEKNPRFYLENFAPECGTNPVKGLQDHQGWRPASDHPVENNRSLANGMDSFLPPNDVIEDHLATRWGQGYAIALRPGDSYTRHFSNLDAGKPDPHYYRPLRGNDPDKGGHRANGVWIYAPDLATHPDVFAESGVTWTSAGVKGPGSVTFKVDAANVVTSAKLTLKGSGAAASTSRDAGITWSKLEGEPDVAGTTQYLVKVDLEGAGSMLEAFSAETITQINRPSMPRLSRGANRVQVRLGPQVETIRFQPSIVQGNHRKTVFEEKSVEVNEKPYFNVSTLRPAAKGPASVTWKIAAPTPILDAVYGGNVTVKAVGDRASLLHSWDGKSYSEDFKKSDGALPYDLMVLASAGQAPPEQTQVFLRYEFESPSPTEKWRAPGIQTALLTVHHRPRRTGFTPIEVTYDWIEHRDDGDVERRHTEIVPSPEHEYSIHVAGYRDPTMKWVRMRLARGEKPGYSDGKDVGPGATPVRATYAWGTNLARGKPYALEGKQSDKNPDGGGDLTDGIIAPPEEYVSVKWMPTNVIFQQDVSPVATIDLGREETVAAVRVHAGQEPGFHLAFPDSISVEVSSDGKNFLRTGQAVHNQVFDPPADHADWELKDSPKYASLPAGGRLAYGYRILFEKPVVARYVRVSCAARRGWGVMLSEIQVFDRASVNTKVPPPVVLPPLARPR